ncbi:DUF2231 domain-containing protein [uncultured Desulfosarcina sp.]|uniref:DUF2231 domain-containing protein n=1 Tax=uncultured Desulfosarcina sp. TaxID=218289 RepID=UPI0029C69C6D|nr:DUF2231 domain-containing protein [uncultured Desulfosarcina sp.]
MIPITEIHPMLVHFPIVLWISAEAIAVVVLLRGGDLSARQQWSMTAFYSLLAGTAFAALAAFFGDIALDHAVAAGFAAGPMEFHETIALITFSIFVLHAILRMLAIWRRYPLTGIRGWLAELPGLVGIVGLLVTAYLGGELVYHMGVNVAAVVR